MSDLYYKYPKKYTGTIKNEARAIIDEIDNRRLIIVDTSTFRPPAIEEYEEILDTKSLPNEPDIPDLK